VNWQRIRDSVRNNNDDMQDKQIAAFGSDYAINFKFLNREQKQIAIENGLVRLHDGATGFMMIKREALDKMIEAYPDLKYNNDLNTPPELNPHFYAFFDTMIDPKDRRYLSEDYCFSRRWQELGGEIWLDPTISLNHYGSFNFQGNPQQIIQIK
jgi:phage/plasmid-associated DNA primase